MDPFLFGHNADERIVAVHLLDDQSLRVYRRENGKTLHSDAEFFPFFLLSEPDLLNDFKGRFWLKELEGTNPFRWIAAFSRWSEMWEAVQTVLRAYNRGRTRKASTFFDVDALFFRPDPARQFLTQSGITLFKGMELADVRMMQIEVQLRPPSAEKKSRRREGLEWVAAISEPGGRTKPFHATPKNEAQVLAELVERIAQADPDVITGFRLTDRILPFLHERCGAHQIPIVIGRDGRTLREETTRSWFATGEGERLEFVAPGRHLVDLVKLLSDHAASLHLVDAPSLQEVAADLGIGEASPPPPTSDFLANAWRGPKADIQSYVAQRAAFAARLGEHLLQVPFEQTRMCPFNFGTVLQLAPHAKVESILFREYIRAKHSVPRPPATFGSSINYSMVYRTGLFRNVLQFDVVRTGAEMIHENGLHSDADPLGALTQLSASLLDHPDSESTAALLRSLPSYLANPRALFSAPAKAEALQNRMASFFNALRDAFDRYNGSLVIAGPDACYCSLPDNVVGEANAAQFVERVAGTLQPPVPLTPGRIYSSLLAVNAKSYALLDTENRLAVHGGTLLSRLPERFLRRFSRYCIECLLTGDFSRLHHTYASFRTMVERRQWKVDDFCRTEIARESTEEYRSAVQSGERGTSAAHEAATRARVYVAPNRPISYYVAGTQEDARLADSCRLAEEWDPNAPDENSSYYLRRLREVASRYREFFNEGDFERIFSMDDLFGFSDRGISVSEQDAAGGVPHPPERPPDTDTPEGFSIWLDETEESPGANAGP